MKFKKGEQDSRNEDQDRGYHKNQPCLHPELFPSKMVIQKVLPGHKAKSARHDQSHNHGVHGDISAVPDEGQEGNLVSKEVKSGVAERGDRMKDRFCKAGPQTEVSHKRNRQQNSAEDFRGQGEQQEKARKADDAPDLRGVYRVLHQVPVPKADSLSRKDGDGDHAGDHPQTADLNQGEDHHFSKR